MPSGRPDVPAGRVAAAIGIVFALVSVSLIYRGALHSYFLNDDVQWLHDARHFDAWKMWHVDRYDHFYRPAIELYFYLGRRFYGCAAVPFHLTSIAVHLLNTWILYELARSVGGRAFGVLTAVLFVAQPGYVEAVVWVAAITDLLPALWYLLTLWLLLLVLRRGGTRPLLYAGMLASFTACLLTHESSATLLPMMLALEFTVRSDGRQPPSAVLRAMARSAAKYAPFVILLLGYLAIEYTVNSRSYLIRDSNYRFGWHAVPHVLQYLASLYVGSRSAMSYGFIGIVAGSCLVFGSPRVRFFIAWIIVTLLPPAFFTWDNTSRYLYVPAAGFAMLLAHGVVRAGSFAERWWPRRTSQWVTAVLAAILAIRFMSHAALAANGIAERTRPYERFAATVRSASVAGAETGVVVVTAEDLEGVGESYRDPAAEVADCVGERHVIVR